MLHNIKKEDNLCATLPLRYYLRDYFPTIICLDGR